MHNWICYKKYITIIIIIIISGKVTRSYIIIIIMADNKLAKIITSLCITMSIRNTEFIYSTDNLLRLQQKYLHKEN